MQQFIFHVNNIGGDIMLKFNKDHIKDLQDFLYHSDIHDAYLECCNYEWHENRLKINVINKIFNVKIFLVFYNVDMFLTVGGNEFGSRETIISLTVEEDFSYLQNYLLKQSEYMEDSLYLLFQMFSGDELHIVSSDVSVEIIRLQSQ